MKAIVLALVLSACGPRAPTPAPSGPAAHPVPVEIDWPDAAVALPPVDATG